LTTASGPGAKPGPLCGRHLIVTSDGAASAATTAPTMRNSTI